MKLYIVRHGESVNNAMKLHQGSNAPLSDKGIIQAKELAKRIAKIHEIDLIISSPYLRTRQTLEEILKLAKHKVVFSDLAIEIVSPPEIIGKNWEDEGVIKIKKLMRENKNNPEWHYSEEENFSDFKGRVIKLLKFIETFNDKNILLVSHGILAKMMIGIMLFGEKLTAEEHDSVEKFLRTENTGITVCEKDETAWKLITWNDHAHLG